MIHQKRKNRKNPDSLIRNHDKDSETVLKHIEKVIDRSNILYKI